jgi:hypothetical protein
MPSVQVAVVPAPAQSPPQPRNLWPGLAWAVSVIERPVPYACVQSVTQAIPGRSLTTVPRAG